jgi:hypothetical protein
MLNDGLSGFAGRGFIANIDVATAHDCYPLLKVDHNAQLPTKVAHEPSESAAPMLGFTGIKRATTGFFTRQRLKSRLGC